MSTIAYEALSDEDRKIVDDFLKIARPLAGQIAKLTSAMSTLSLDYNDTVSPIINGLDDTDRLPNKTDLSEAKAITKLDVVDFMNGLNFVGTNYNQDANRTRWGKMAGVSNII